MFPATIHLFKSNNKKTRIIYEICSKYPRKTPEQLCCVLVSDFKYILHGLLVFPLLMLNKKYRLGLYYHRHILLLKFPTLILGGICPSLLNSAPCPLLGLRALFIISTRLTCLRALPIINTRLTHLCLVLCCVATIER